MSLSSKERRDLLNDYAAEAMNGLVAGMPDRLTTDAEALARRAFAIAWAMVEESKRQEVSGDPPGSIV